MPAANRAASGRPSGELLGSGDSVDGIEWAAEAVGAIDDSVTHPAIPSRVANASMAQAARRAPRQTAVALIAASILNREKIAGAALGGHQRDAASNQRRSEARNVALAPTPVRSAHREPNRCRIALASSCPLWP